MESKEILVGKNKRNDFLKAFAMATMLIDHIGLMFFPEMMIFRTIGRMAFPIFAYFIACGYDYTSSLKHYIKRLLIVGLITQVPYSFLNTAFEFTPLHFNILFTLILGLLFIQCINTGIKYLKTICPRIEIY